MKIQALQAHLMFGHDTQVVAFYPYRTALVIPTFKIGRDQDIDLWEAVKEFLTDKGFRMDNHICWTTADGLSFMWTDGCLKIGTKIEVRSW